MVPLDHIANTPEVLAREKFTGKEFDEEGSVNGACGVQAYHFGARVYDPEIGVWLACDAAGQFYNPYGYATNPILSVDSDGNWSWLPVAIGAVTGGICGAIADQDNLGMGFLKGAAIGAVGGALSNFGGGSFLNNVGWGAAGGAITGGLWAWGFGGDIGKGILYGAASGAGGAAAQSFGEMAINAHDGYGWYTNEGTSRRLVADATAGGNVDPVKAQAAINFVQKRYGMSGVNMTFDNTPGAYGTTDLNANIKIGEAAFSSSSMLKATMVHEYGHAMENVIVGQRFVLPNRAAWNYNDGTTGYSYEIRNSGRMHISPSALSALNPNGSYANPLWYCSGMSKWLYTVPQRF